MRGIILLFSVFIGGGFKISAAYNQLISSKSKTDCQKTSFIVSLKNRKFELKSVSLLIINTIQDAKKELNFDRIYITLQIKSIKRFHGVEKAIYKVNLTEVSI
jgi:hypothetical protein